MKQLKTMGYSALLLILLCLTTTNGFLKTERKNLQERNDQFNNNRNFFGNTWRKSLEITEERRELDGERRRVKTEPIFEDRRTLVYRRNANEKDQNRFVREDTRRIIDNSRRQGRRLFSLPEREIRSTLHREDDARQRTIDNLQISSTRKEERLSRFPSARERDIRSSSFDRSRRIIDNSRRQMSEQDHRNVRENRDRDIRSSSLNRYRQNRVAPEENKPSREIRLTTDRDDRYPRVIDDSRRHIREQTLQVPSDNSRRQVREEGRFSRVVRQDRRIIDNSRRQVNEGRLSRLVRQDRQRDTRRVIDNIRQDRRSFVREEERLARLVRETRSISLDRSGENRRTIDTSRRQSREDERTIGNARQQDRRISEQQTRSSSLDRSRQNGRTIDVSRRQVKEDERISRLANQDRERETYRTIDNDRRISEQRRDTRFASLDRSRQNRRTIDISRRQVREDERNSRFANQDRERESRETNDRRISEQRRDSRSVSLDRSRENRQTIDISRRQVREDDRISRLANQDRERETYRIINNDRQISDQRRDTRSASLDRSRQNRRTIDVSRREVREGERLSRLSNQDRERVSRQTIDNVRQRISEDRLTRFARDTRSSPSDTSRRTIDDSHRRIRITDNSGRQITEQNRRISSVRGVERMSREIRSSSTTRDRRTSNENRIRIKNDHRQVRESSDATRRILILSSKDENNNIDSHRYFARIAVERNMRQSKDGERRMATSFQNIEKIDYIPEMKSNMLMNAAKVVLLSFLITQIISDSSKSKKKWFHNITNFVTVTKAKVL